jgi:hypothetical protein
MYFKNWMEKTIKYFYQRPVSLFFLLLICFSLILSLAFNFFGHIISENSRTILFVIGMLFFVILIPYSILKYYKRKPLDDFTFPLISGTALIYYTVVLIILFFVSNSIYINDIDPNLNHLTFIIAIFAFGVSLFHLVVAQFSSENKLGLISEQLEEIKKNSIRFEIKTGSHINRIINI